VGAILLPGLAFSVLFLAPFLDSGAEQSLRKRKVTAVIGFGLLAAVVGLTVASLI
jgi:quinol-cytochrome oxidoreductase complex cytochrome b subunit